MAILLDALSIETRTNCFLGASRQLIMSNFFKLGLVLNDLILVLSFENFLSTFTKMADYHGIKDSLDIFLSDNNFPLITLSKTSLMLSLLFSNLWSLVPYN